MEKAEPKLGKYDVVLSVDRNIEGVFDLDDATKVITENGEITTIGKELPSYDAVDTGLFLCKTAVFPRLQEIYDTKGDVSISDVMGMEAREKKFACAEMTGHLWQDVDTPSMKNEAEERLIDNYLKKDSEFDFFSNKLFVKCAKEIALLLLGKEHFDWNLLNIIVFVLSFITTSLALVLRMPKLSIFSLLLVTFLFYINKIRNNVRTVPLKNENFVFSWKFGFVLAVLPVVFNTCQTVLIGFPLFLIMLFISMIDVLKLDGFIQFIGLPQMPERVALIYFSPSLFWIVYAVSVILLPKWFVGFIPLLFSISFVFSREKRN